MTEEKYKEFVKIYDKFKDNNLPTPFWDDERQSREYVYFADAIDKDGSIQKCLQVYDNLSDALGDVFVTSFYYSYNCKPLSFYEPGEDGTFKKGHMHAHSFENVVNDLYMYPESFEILKEDEIYYSNQQLAFLKKIKNYLLLIGLKDYDGKNDDNRYNNKLLNRYIKAGRLMCSSSDIEKFISGTLNFVVGYEDYPRVGDEFLITDENSDFKIFVKFIKEEKKTLEDAQGYNIDDALKNKDYVYFKYFEIIEKF